MSRYTGPKNRRARAVGRDLGLKTNTVKLERRLKIKPGQHGPKSRRSKTSDYGKQLTEKQKVRWAYGIHERQFQRYYVAANKSAEATGMRLLQLLETRLDNIIYRLKLAPTRNAARQFVTHGHILVNNKKVSIPSYQVKKGDVVQIDHTLVETPILKSLLAEKKPEVPQWLERKAAVGKMVRLPERKEIDADINEQLIVEYYSR